MPVREEPWTHGTPTLLTLTTPDPRAAAELYANLFAWDLEYRGDDVVATIAGHLVAAFFAGAEPRGWSTHLIVDDIYVAMGTARAAGAQMSDPRRLEGYGILALGRDPQGAELGLWQPDRPESLVAQEGTLLWSELMVRDVPAAKTFYDILMDARFEEVDEDADYLTLHTRDGELVAGLGRIDEEYGDDVPNHWMPYFDTDDLEETFALAGAVGGEPIMGPTTGEFGEIAIVVGTAGEVFGLMQVPLDVEDETRVEDEVDDDEATREDETATGSTAYRPGAAFGI